MAGTEAGLACFPLADFLVALAPTFLGGMVWKRQINRAEKRAKLHRLLLRMY
jgi:hypothetical protein